VLTSAEEFEAYLKRGLLEHGFLRVTCDVCHAEKLVAFSCKGRGSCPSRSARRMAETAALLVNEVLPEEPLRQWVLSLPFALRFLLSTHPDVLTHVLGIVYRAISGHILKRAGLSRSTPAVRRSIRLAACLTTPGAATRMVLRASCGRRHARNATGRCPCAANTRASVRLDTPTARAMTAGVRSGSPNSRAMMRQALAKIAARAASEGVRPGRCDSSSNSPNNSTDCRAKIAFAVAESCSATATPAARWRAQRWASGWPQDGAGERFRSRDAPVEPVNRHGHHQVPPASLEVERERVSAVGEEDVARAQCDRLAAAGESGLAVDMDAGRVDVVGGARDVRASV